MEEVRGHKRRYSSDDDPEESEPSRKSCRNLTPDELEEQRLKVNSRERQRMHDMNGAMDALRAVMPYAQGPAVKKLSKMNTLLLARNYILLLSRSIEETKTLLAMNPDPVSRHPAGLPTLPVPAIPNPRTVYPVLDLKPPPVSLPEVSRTLSMSSSHHMLQSSLVHQALQNPHRHLLHNSACPCAMCIR